MKNLIIQLLIITFIFNGCKKDNLDPEIQKMSAIRGYQDWYIGTFRCGVFVPPSYDRNKKYPLVVYLHGRGDTTTWNMKWYNEPIVTSDPCIVITPKCPRDEASGWGSSFDPSTSPMMTKAFEMIDKVEKAFNLDQDRYYIHGTSMGGYGTYGVLQKHPDMFAAAYVECGAASLNIAPLLINTPLWIFHGSADPVVYVQPDRNLYQAVRNLGGTQIRYTEYPGVGHNVWDYVPNETTLSTWFFAQRIGSVHNAPVNVSNFKGQLFSGKKVFLEWNIPQENLQEQDNKIWFCRIYRNADVIQEIYNNHNNYIDSTIVSGNTYEYKISAVNYYFKESSLSGGIMLNLK